MTFNDLLTLIVYVLDAVLLCVLINLIMSRKNEIVDRERTRRRTRRMVLTAMFLSFALALKYFSVSFPLFGANGMRINFAGIFTAFPAFLFGPFYGAMTSAMSDLLGFFLKPSGDYNPIFTLVAFLGGFIKGALWLVFRRKWSRKASAAVRWCVAALMALICLTGVAVNVSLRNDGVVDSFVVSAESVPDKESMNELLEGDVSEITRLTAKLVETKKASYQNNLAFYINLATVGFVCVGILLGVLLAVDTLLLPVIRRRRKAKKGDSSTATTADGDTYIRIFICILISGLIVTTINTKVIMWLYGIQVPFLIYWIPRVLEEILVCTIQAYFISVLYTATKHLFTGDLAVRSKRVGSK